MKYLYIKRIPVPGFSTRGSKPYMTDEEIDVLFSGEVVIEEKIDGTLLAQPLMDYLYLYEDVRYVHTVFYDKLRATTYPFKIGLDVLSPSGILLDYDRKRLIFTTGNESAVPSLIYKGHISYRSVIDNIGDLIGQRSAFGSENREGVVIKNYQNGIMGKIVDPKFEIDVDSNEHWSRKPRRCNRVNNE